MAYKTVSGTRTAEIQLDGSVYTVNFGSSYNYYAVRNDSDGTIYVSTTDKSCTPNNDGVVSIPSGGAYVHYNGFGGSPEIYISGTGGAVIIGQDDGICPFKSVPKGGDGGGSGGVSDYRSLDNKPLINNEVVEGNKTLQDYGLPDIASPDTENPTDDDLATVGLVNNKLSNNKDYNNLTNRPINNSAAMSSLSGNNTSNWYDIFCIENMRSVCQFFLLISVYYDTNSSETMFASVTLSSPKNIAKFQLLSGMGANIFDQVKITSDNRYTNNLYYWNIQFHLASSFANVNRANIQVCVELICDPKQFGNINYWVFPNSAVPASQSTRFLTAIDLEKPFSYNDLRDTPNIPIVDSALSDTSTNSVQNNVITEAINALSDRISQLEEQKE